MGSPTQTDTADRQPAAIPTQLSRGGSVYAAPTATARQQLRVADFATDPSTRIAGVSILSAGDHDLLLIDLPRAVEGPLSFQIGPMARQLRLRPDDLWRALIGMRQNVALLTPLWQQEMGDEAPPRYLEELRRRLREEGEGELWTNESGPIAARRVYSTWMVPDVDEDGRPLRIVVPMSGQFRTWELQQRRNTLTRQAMGVGRRLEGPVETLRTRTEWLTSTQLRLLDALTGTAQAAARIETLEALVRSCLQHPEQEPKQRASLEGLLTEVEAFNAAVKATLTSEQSPSPSVVINLQHERDCAVQLLEALTDKQLVSTVNQLIAYGPNAPQGDLNYAAEAVGRAVVALLASPALGASVYERYVIPMLDALGGAELIPVRQPTVVDSLARVAALVPGVVGNVPGPSSMCVAIMQAAARYMLPGALANKSEAAALARRVTGVLGRVLGFNAAERAELSKYVGDQYVKSSRDFISNRFQAGRTTNGILAVVHIALLIATIEDEDPFTLAKWNTVLSSGAQATSASLQFVKGAQAVATSRLGAATGFITGVAAGLAVVVSVEAAYNDGRVGDSTGVTLNMVGALAALASFAGWAITFGAFTSLKGFGVPLMVAGAVLSVGVFAAQWIRDATTPGPQRLFTAYLIALETGSNDPEGGSYVADHLAWVLQAVAREEPVNPAQQGLATAYRRLLDGHRDATWVDIRHDRDLARTFHDRFGVQGEALAVLFDVDEDDLPTLLQR